ncbi:hypothetical protein LTR87_003317 [Friedmanniomyces endolithicus]|nr:hypothetical protein LTR87_003317 [Friedmanniomyces endolithicus]
MPRESMQSDLFIELPDPTAVGLPPVSPKGLPDCYEYNAYQPCNWTQLLPHLKSQQPIFAPGQQSTYGNTNFELLGLVLERVTGLSYEQYMAKAIFDPIGMESTTLRKPESDKHAVLPVGQYFWDVVEGVHAPTGGIYSSSSDMSKPVTFVTKSGGVPSYYSKITMMPEYGLGLTVLLGGNNKLLGEIQEAVNVPLIRAAEDLIWQDVDAAYSGTYSTPDSHVLNSTLTLAAYPTAGLQLIGFISNGTDVFNTLLAQWAGLIDSDSGRWRVQLMPTLLYKNETRDWFSREELPTLLVPDYEKPARNVHRDAARYLLELPGSSSGLRTLQEVHHTEEPATSTAARPSWVPFWVHQDSGSGWSAPDLVATFQRYTAHSAHNDTMVDIRPAMLEDLDVLELSGLFIDTIVDASEIFQYEDLAEDDNGVKVRQLVDRVVELLGVDHKCPDALWEVAVFLFAGTPEWSKEQTLQNFHYYLLYLMERQRQPPNPDGPTANAQFGARKASEFMRALAAVWPGCRLFSTSNGRVGFARAVIQPGDELIIFYGGRVPFVLRSAGEYHQLLSQAHVHGIMKGEAMRHHQTEGTPSQLFRLR